MMLDADRSRELAQQINSKAKSPFENAYRAALATAGAVYVQGFLAIAGRSNKPIEHAWIQVDETILDPTLPYLKSATDLSYFAAHRVTVKQLKAAIEEAKEDYPDDDPLPIYGPQPYEYYGDVMLGGKEYQTAFEAAQRQCKDPDRN